MLYTNLWVFSTLKYLQEYIYGYRYSAEGAVLDEWIPSKPSAASEAMTRLWWLRFWCRFRSHDAHDASRYWRLVKDPDYKGNYYSTWLPVGVGYHPNYSLVSLSTHLRLIISLFQSQGMSLVWGIIAFPESASILEVALWEKINQLFGGCTQPFRRVVQISQSIVLW